MGHFREGRQSLLGAFSSLLGGGGGGGSDPAAAAQKADIFIALNASTVELADLGEQKRMLLLASSRCCGLL